MCGLIWRVKETFRKVRGWLYVRLRGEVKIKTCMAGKCWCAGAHQCFFNRCKNCDACVNADGEYIDSGDWAEEWQRCPDCGSKL
jgi:hypothetical protein